MRLGLSNLRDTVGQTVGYTWRIIAGANRVRDAIIYTLPGYFTRPNDDGDTGTEDCLHLENGDERLVFATRNARALERLLSYLGREFDKGEAILTSEDGTNRAVVSLRPNGDVSITADDGGANTCSVLWDASTGNVEIDSSGTVNIGASTYKLVRWENLESYFNTAVAGIVDKYNGHIHNDSLGAPTTAPLAIWLWSNLPASIAAAIGRCS